MSGDEKGGEGVTVVVDVVLILECCFSCQSDVCESRDV